MPKDYLWDTVDFVPLIVDAQLTGRGGWRWHSDVLGGDVEAGLYASFTTGAKLLVQKSNGHLYEITDSPPYAAVDKGAIVRSRQNPVQMFNTVVHFDRGGLTVPTLIPAPGGAVTIGALDATAPKARYGTVYKSFLVAGGTPGEEDIVRFSLPGASGVTSACDANSFVRASQAITSLAALRAVILVFHSG